MKKILKSENGFTGVEIAVAIVILMIFVSLISTIFINIYLSFTDAQRSSIATGYATQLAETIDKMYYEEVEESNLIRFITDEIRIPNGYDVDIEIIPYSQGENSKDLVKTVIITVNYRVGNNSKKVKIERIKPKEILITPNKPKLSNGMVPVKYVTKDSESYWIITTEDDSTWYNYDNKRWANIMLQDGLTVEGDIEVTDENRKSLAGKKVTTLGSMFVWIPRYAYKIPEENLHTSNAGEIDIVFLYSTSNNYVDENGNMRPITNMEGYKIHPSFQNGEANDYANGGWDKELTGYWVAKFEASSTDTTAQKGGGDTTELNIKVLPSKPSWRDITASNIFEVCQNMNKNENIYKISNTTEPHMMKNTEWGAVAYLSQSKYGIKGQIWNNPYCESSTYTILTGKVASTDGANATETTLCDNYNKGNGPKGSTTGNVYGVYDMASGSWEYVAAFIDSNYAMNHSDMANVYSNKGTKYVDVYEISEEDTEQANFVVNASKYGDAIYETSVINSTQSKAWYQDTAIFPYGEERCIFVRSGGSWQSYENPGLFYYSAKDGQKNSYYSFRPVITIP